MKTIKRLGYALMLTAALSACKPDYESMNPGKNQQTTIETSVVAEDTTPVKERPHPQIIQINDPDFLDKEQKGDPVRIKNKDDLTYLRTLCTLEDAIKCAALKFPDGNPVFTDKPTMAIYLGSGASIDEIEPLMDLKDINGEIIFSSGESITQFMSKGGTIEKAKKFAESCTKRDIFIYNSFGITEIEDIQYKDTNKPNALIVVPKKDYNGAIINNGLKLLRPLRETYDTKIVITDNEDDVYDAIRDTPNIELLVLGGHGSPDSLQLGNRILTKGKWESPNRYVISHRYNEKSEIGIDDPEISQKFSYLDKDAVIFLMSCSTGKGERSLADFIAKNVPGRRVIAPKYDISIAAMTLTNIHPFDINLGLPRNTYNKKYNM